MIKGCKKILALAFLSVILLNPMVTVVLEVNAAVEDDVSQQEGDSGNSQSSGTVSQEDQNVANWIKDQRGFSSKQLQTASEALSPLTIIMGNIVGGIVVLIFAGVFVITGLDILYITIPPIREYFYVKDSGGGAMGGAMGGYGAMGGGQQGGSSSNKRQWISDEAVQCSALFGGSSQGNDPYGGQQQQQGAKSVLATYFKKRIFFMILLAICVIVLTSSALLGTGVNLAQWLLKIIDVINNSIPK